MQQGAPAGVLQEAEEAGVALASAEMKAVGEVAVAGSSFVAVEAQLPAAGLGSLGRLLAAVGGEYQGGWLHFAA